MDIASETARAYQAFAAGRNAEAADCAKRILDQAPDDPAALTLIGRLAHASGEPEVAHAVARRVLEGHPRKAALWLDLAIALRELGRHRQAAEAVERALALEDADQAAWIRLGEIRLSLNEREPAALAFHRALAMNPASVPAHRGLCQAEEVVPDSAIAERMRVLLDSAKLSPAEAAGLHYTLAQVYRRAGRREPFIQHLFRANAIQRSICPDGRAEYEAIFNRLESAFTAETFGVASRADPVEPVPIFILGMPRSGTTLLEQLIAGHPEVATGGEVDYMRRSLRRAVERHTGFPFPQRFEAIPAQDLTAMARAYAGRLDLIGQGSRYVTDKTPSNYHLLGLLRLLFPQGRIVHMARDPMDTCFSILQYPFDDRSPHTCDIDLLAYAYARYRRLMRRWQDLFGDEFITVEYERLVESPGTESRRVFEHCGLAWSDAYLEFHRSDGAVRTFSAPQVRRPIYRSSAGAWREFSDELEPLCLALQAQGESVS